LLGEFGKIDSKFVTDLYLDSDFRLKIAESITNLTKTDISNKKDISKNIIRNMDLIWLNRSVYDRYLTDFQITECFNRIVNHKTNHNFNIKNFSDYFIGTEFEYKSYINSTDNYNRTI